MVRPAGIKYSKYGRHMAGITEQPAVPQSHFVFTLISHKKGQWQKRGHISKDVLKAVNVFIKNFQVVMRNSFS